MTSAPGHEPAGTPQGKAAELLAAVRAVERGERSADSFFREPAGAAGADAGRDEPRRRSADTRTGEARPPGPPAGTPAEPATPPDAVDTTAPPKLLALLAEGGAPDTLAGPVLRHLGPQAAALLREDPWHLLAVPGVQPEQADGFARALLGGACGPGDPRRVRALAEWLLHRAALAGHTVLDAATLHGGLARYAVPDPEEAVRDAVEDGAVLVFREPANPADGGRATDAHGADHATGPEEPTEPAMTLLFGLERYAVAEESLADGLLRLRDAFPGAGGGAGGTSGPDPSAWETAASNAPSSAAAELLRAVADHALVLHSGGEAARAEPAAVVAATRAMGLRAVAATHAEDGRRRLARLVTDADPTAGDSSAEEADPGRRSGDDTGAVTVTGLLAGREGPDRNEDGTLSLDLLVVLDAPQLAVETAAALVESLPDGARLVLSGDPRLLGAAGAGRPFTDLLAAGVRPHIPSRTPDPGPIGELVSGIGVGELNQVAAPDREVVVVPVREPGEAVHRTVQVVTDSVPRALGVPTARTQVITVGHGGGAGTRALNAALKERLNPGPGRFAGFDPGDRVAYTPTPGHTSVGTVISADADGLRLEVDGHRLTVPRRRLGETVRHGWAITAHQAAGLRWPAVVVVLPGDAVTSLDRSWVYTAFSRGERHLSVVQGAGEALARAVAERPAAPRRTRLRTLLREQSTAPH